MRGFSSECNMELCIRDTQHSQTSKLYSQEKSNVRIDFVVEPVCTLSGQGICDQSRTRDISDVHIWLNLHHVACFIYLCICMGSQIHCLRTDLFRSHSISSTVLTPWLKKQY